MIEKASPSVQGEEFAATSTSRGKLRISVIVGLLCCLVYSANFRAISAGDTYPARYLPFALWRWHTVLLDPIVGITAQGWNPITPGRAKGPLKGVDPQEAFWVVRLRSGHAVSLYPVVVPLLVSPLYLPAVAYLHATGWDQHRLDQIAKIMEKISAALLAAISAALFYLVLRRRSGQRTALLLTFAYAFGTTTWVISSQALWQHGVGELLVVCALFLLTGHCTRWRAIFTGVVLGLIACNRPPDALIAAALGIYGLCWAGRFRLLVVAAAVLPLVPLLIYNLGIIGHVAGAYGLIGDLAFFRHDLLSGLAGLLFSPTKGLFVFSPFLIFVPFCLPRILRDPATCGLAIAAVCAVVVQLLVYGAADWRQGGSWGPRWLTDLLPLLVWLLAPALDEFRNPARIVFLFAAGAGVVIEAIGAFWYTGESNVAIYASAAGMSPMGPAWELQNAPFIAELRHPRAPFDLTADVRGYVDVIQVGYGTDGREISIDGWALADGSTPAEVVVLVDGHVAASTAVFGPRPDVSKTLGAKGPSGWHVTTPANHLAGNHVIAVLARANPGGGVSLIAERNFEVPAIADLSSSSHRAADILASQQEEAGYWLTAHTTQMRFEHPQMEMNTFLPAVMLDILNPVADLSGVQPNVQRARDFLRRQIEANGLVRYHGLASAPTIGTLGCAITPDADDTALTWRVAPSTRKELQSAAFNTISAFRTADGLYRTWLAPRDRYECIDPGSDPNPTDIAIQMHVYLWLSQVDQSAAKALCAAIERSVDDDRVWVYYKNAPLIPMLRQIDLREAGCPVSLPISREQSAVPGQEVWMRAARMLEHATDAGSSRTNPAEVREWLQKVADDNFAIVRRTPPLLYHNDRTASVSRFYWSEEFGYALWLRLYFELGRQATRDSM